jgi:hypothetical protein
MKLQWPPARSRMQRAAMTCGSLEETALMPHAEGCVFGGWSAWCGMGVECEGGLGMSSKASVCVCGRLRACWGCLVLSFWHA